MLRLFQGFLFLALAALVLSAVGCHFGPMVLPDSGATLEGTVKYGDEPVMVAMIIATSAKGEEATGSIEDGHYKIINVPLGEVKLGVNVKAGNAMLAGQRRAGTKTPKVTPVPDKYENPETSGIKTTINKGSNTYDIVIPK